MPAGYPSTAIEALTMLYLQNRDISWASCEELVTMYAQAYQEIGVAYLKAKSERAFNLPGTGSAI